MCHKYDSFLAGWLAGSDSSWRAARLCMRRLMIRLARNAHVMRACARASSCSCSGLRTTCASRAYQARPSAHNARNTTPARQPDKLTFCRFPLGQQYENTDLLLFQDFNYWLIRCAIVDTSRFCAAGLAVVAAVRTVAGTAAGTTAGTAAGIGRFSVAAETASQQFYYTADS